MRAPSIRARAASATWRPASIHFPGATRDEERGGTFYPAATVEIRAERSRYDSRAKLVLPADMAADLVCSEIAALGALAEVTIEIGPEDIAPRDQFERADDIAAVEASIKQGNEWAWCWVKVTAKWLGFEGSDSLGACSYASEADFRRPGGYFDDMRETALRELKGAIERAGRA